MRRAEYQSKPLDHSPPPERQRRRLPRLKGIIHSLGLLGVSAGLVGGAGEVIADDPLALPNQLTVTFQDIFASCDQLPGDTIHRWQTRLKNDALTSTPKVGGTDAQNIVRAKKYGLHLADEDAKIRKRIEATPDPQAAVAITNDFMEREYGIEVRARAPVDEADKQDSLALLGHVHQIPSELVQAVARKDFSIVSFGDDRGDAAAGYSPVTGTLSFEPGEVDNTFAHEFGHALNRAASRKRCTMATVKQAPDFVHLNPSWFEYGGPMWEQVTTSEYTSKDEIEAYAGGTEAFMFTQPVNTAGCIIGKSAIIDSKMAVIAADMESVAPRTGEYFSARLGQECPMSP